MIKEDLKLKGSMVATLSKPNGDVEVTRKDNIIVQGGFDFICDAIGKGGSGRPSQLNAIAVGRSNRAPALDDKALYDELTRKEAIYQHTAGEWVFKFTTTFEPDAANYGAITEAGVLNSSDSSNPGILFDRVVFDVINKGAEDTLTLVFTFVVSATI